MYKNLYEVFDEFEKAQTLEQRADVLRRNDGHVLYSVLRGAFNPNIKYLVERIPHYKPSDAPIGMGYTTIHRELDRLYLFELGNPRRPAGLSEKRMTQILIQMLEGLEAKEAVIFANMLLKNLKIKNLNEDVIKLAFPDKSNLILG